VAVWTSFWTATIMMDGWIPQTASNTQYKVGRLCKGLVKYVNNRKKWKIWLYNRRITFNMAAATASSSSQTILHEKFLWFASDGGGKIFANQKRQEGLGKRRRISVLCRFLLHGSVCPLFTVYGHSGGARRVVS
jgi:hypothetical protein